MKTVLAQIKLKTADFKFNAENIINNAAKCDCDLIIFPQSDIEDLGGKDLVLDETCRKGSTNFIRRLQTGTLNKIS